MEKEELIGFRYKLQHYVAETGHWNDLEEYTLGDYPKAEADFRFYREKHPSERCRVVRIKTHIVLKSE